MYKHVIFDFNGTVIDDVELCLNLLNEILVMQNNKPISLEKYKAIFTFPISDYYLKAGVDFKKNTFEELAINFIEKYQPASYKCNLFPKSEETFNYLINKGIKLYILSASQKTNLVAQTDYFKISKYFNAILGLDDIKAESKVNIAIDYINNNEINTNEVLLVGDTLHDLEVASNTGIDCILVSSGHQSREVLETGGVEIIDSIASLMDIL